MSLVAAEAGDAARAKEHRAGRSRGSGARTRGRAQTHRSATVPGEDHRVDLHVVVRELLDELRAQPGGHEPAEAAAVLVEALGVVVEEDVLEGDHVALHPLHLGDVGDAPGAVAEPGLVDDEVDRGGDLLADGADRQVHAGHQHHRLDAGQGVAGAVRVDGADRAVVAGVHRLEHVERGGVADLADDDAVGPHAQGVLHQVADVDRALALDVRRAGLQPQHVVLVQLELGGVLDRDDALVAGDERREHVERGRLAGAGAAGHDDVELAAHAGGEELARCAA